MNIILIIIINVPYTIYKKLTLLTHIIKALWSFLPTLFRSNCICISFLFFSSIIHRCLLMILIFSDYITKIRLSFSELHFIHTFTSIPMKESFSSEYHSELFQNVLEPMKVKAILRLLGGISHTTNLMLLGIHSTK